LRIKKVKVTKEKRILIMYEKKGKNGWWDEYSLTCSEDARPEFHQTLRDLRTHVLDMCELPENYLDRLTVRGVSFSYGGEAEVMGATISASMELYESNQGLNINTPHKAEDSYCDAPADPKQLLDAKCIKCLDRLMEESELYIQGDRAQGSLFPEVIKENIEAAQLN
jgi:hypothetical protein